MKSFNYYVFSSCAAFYFYTQPNKSQLLCFLKITQVYFLNSVSGFLCISVFTHKVPPTGEYWHTHTAHVDIFSPKVTPFSFQGRVLKLFFSFVVYLFILFQEGILLTFLISYLACVFLSSLHHFVRHYNQQVNSLNS